MTVENKVVGNFVGTDLTGTRATAATRNGLNGVHLEDGVINNTVSDNVIGNSASLDPVNAPGIEVEGFYTAGNVLARNRVGVSLDGTAIPNANYGILVHYHATNTVIGPNNLVANNPIGIAVTDGDNDFNRITGNLISG